MGKIPSFAGLGTGIVGFVLTLVYVIESGLVFNDNDGSMDIKIDSDGSLLKWDNSKNNYVCIFYDKDNEESLYLKYSNYGNKFLNYNKDVFYKEKEKKYEYYHTMLFGSINLQGCNYEGYISSSNIFEKCKNYEEK